MKCGKNYFEESKSSFLSTDKDLSLIIGKILKNDKLLKMLYYTQKDCLEAPNLTAEQKLSMVDNQIKIVPDLTDVEIYGMLEKQLKIVPNLTIAEECPNFVIVTFDNFIPNASNPEFRDCTINFDILCHPDHWNLGNFQLRPHKIAGEIDAMFNDQYLTGIGTVQFAGGNNLVLNDQLMGMSLMYRTIHGDEDKRNPLT